MRKRSIALVMALALIIGLLPMSVGAAPMYEIGVEFPVSLADNGQVQPEIDFPWIVWKDNRDCDGDSESDIYAYNFVTGEEVQVSDHEACESNPSISGDWVVYSNCISNDDYSSVWAYNLATGEERALFESYDNDLHVGNPSIDGSIVVFNYWDDRGDQYDGDIWVHSLETGQSWAMNPREPHQFRPDIGDGWATYRQVDYDWNEDSIYAFNLDTEDEVLVAEGYHVDWSNRWELRAPSTDDGKVVYAKRIREGGAWVSNSIMLYDLETSSETTLSTVNDSTTRRHPVISDGLVTWHDFRVGAAEVYGYDLAAEEEFLIVPAVWDDGNGDGGWIQFAGRSTTSGGIVAWHDHRDEGINNDGIDSCDLYALFLRAQETGLAGANRYATAIAVSEANYPEGSDTVVIATGMNFPDALAGASLAGLNDAPVLLVSDRLPAAVAAEIERLGATDAIILGGTRAVPASVATALNGLGLEVRRLGGANRFETAKLIAEEAIGLMEGWEGEAFLATGYNWPDALSAGPLSAATGWPIFLGGPAGEPITDYTAKAMDDLGVEQVYVLGGPAVISLSEEGDMAVQALAGEDRYETAAVISEFGVSEIGLSMGSLAIATGERYPDALTAGPGQGVSGGSLLITPKATTSPAIMGAISDNDEVISIVKFIGGLEAITQGVRNSIMALLQ